jgi:hypothetical protein
MMIWFIRGLGRNRRRLWSARQVTSTKAPPSGMNRSRRLISPSEDGKSVPKLIRPRTAWVCEGVDGAFSVFQNRRSTGDSLSSRHRRGGAGASELANPLAPRSSRTSIPLLPRRAEHRRSSQLDAWRHTSKLFDMRTTLDIPEPLLEEARHVLGFKSKTDMVVLALQELVRKRRIEELKSLLGSVSLEIDIPKSRRRP